MPKEKLTSSDRRALVLRGLRGESPSTLSKEYDVARSWVYVLLDEAKANPHDSAQEAREEAEFREAVIDSLS